MFKINGVFLVFVVSIFLLSCGSEPGDEYLGYWGNEIENQVAVIQIKKQNNKFVYILNKRKALPAFLKDENLEASEDVRTHVLTYNHVDDILIVKFFKRNELKESMEFKRLDPKEAQVHLDKIPKTEP
ncbi:MAG: hypothetical protein CV087_16700 [Candidatus Brocadia sp. WS118]|nr:MAG: hypothetical protein CV087_16700 [Candidatus Brocadia sp. WS118]